MLNLPTHPRQRVSSNTFAISLNLGNWSGSPHVLLGLLSTLLILSSALGCGQSVDQKAQTASAKNAAFKSELDALAVEPTELIPIVGDQNLLEARASFVTKLQPCDYQAAGPAAEPPAEIMRLVKYPSDVGELAAYLTPDPGDGEKNPAVIWAHGGFGGIGRWFWEPARWSNDQSARAFREAGIVMLCPAWRGECDNPGQFEMFYGEVNDLLAAREYLAGLPYVDPERIYVAGHSTGGTLTLLAVTATDKFRAAFSFGGAADVARVVSDGRGSGSAPFNFASKRECFYRSAIHFVHAIKTPTFYFEGQNSPYCEAAQEMEERARPHHVPFRVCIIQEADHFDILSPLTRFVAAHIQRDSGETCQIEITSELANEFFHLEQAKHTERRAKALAELPLIEIAPAALAQLLEIARANGLDLEQNCLRVGQTEGRWDVKFDEYHAETDQKIVQGPLTIVVAKSAAEQVHGYLINYAESDGKAGYVFEDRVPDR